MTAIEERIFDCYGRLRGTCAGLPPLTLATLRRQVDAPVPSGDRPSEGAWARVREIARHFENGWVRRRSSLWASDADRLEDLDDPEDGPPFWAEWASPDGSSIHLRPDPTAPGQYLFHRLEEARHVRGDAVPADSIVVLREQVHVLRDTGATLEGSVRPVLVYHVFWAGTPQDRYGIRRLHHRFAGFEARDVRIPPSRVSSAAAGELAGVEGDAS